MKLFKHWLTIALAGVAFLLPWQARWMYGSVLIDGAHTEFGVMSVYVVEGLIFLLAAIVAVAMVRRAPGMKVKPEYQPALRAAAIFLIIAIAATAFVDHQAFSLSMCVHLVAAAVFIALCLLDAVRLPVVLSGFVAGMVVPAMIGLVQVFTGASPASTWLGMAARDAAQLGDAVFTVDGKRMLRAYGTFSHPNVFGGYLAVALFAWWHLMTRYRSYWSHTTYTFTGAFGTIFLLASLLLAGSRSAMLGVGIGLLVIMVFRLIRKPKLARITAAGIGVLAIGSALVGSFVFADVAADLRGGGVNEERSLSERAALYKDFVPLVVTMNPYIGEGVGAYVIAAANLQPGKDIFDYQPVHNAWALMFAEIGLLGAIAVGALAFSILRTLVRHTPHPAALTAVGMVTALLVISVFDHYLWSSWAGLALVGFVACISLRLAED
jgi:hypothetical protein